MPLSGGRREFLSKLRLGVALRFRATSLRRVLARDRLVTEHWYLCCRAAQRFKRRGLDRADLQQVAAIGLIKAVDRYDPSRSAPFEAYAWLLIVGELMHHVRDSERFLRAPRGVRDLERRWAAAERELWPALGREPTQGDVARFLGASAEQVREIRAYRASNHLLSFDVLRNGEHGGSLCSTGDVLDRLTVESILQALPPLERQIVRSIDLDGITVVE